jgi:lactate permease
MGIKMWQQNYSILGNNVVLTAIVAGIPVYFLFWALAIKKMKGYLAGICTLGLSLLVAIFLYRMPVGAAFSSALLGIVNGLVPIVWIIIAAVFLFNLVVKSGQFEVIKSSISSISPDRRIQTILIAFCFSAFMEGVAGQGVPVAIAAVMLIGLGFDPLKAAVLSLVGNVVPVAFGPVGVPTITTATVGGISVNLLTKSIGREMLIFCIISPIFLMVILSGWKKAMEVLPAALVAGCSFGLSYFVITNFVGPELVSIVSSIFSLVCLTVFLRFWKPKTIWRLKEDEEAKQPEKVTAEMAATKMKYTGGQIFRAWSPFMVIMIVMYVWSSTPFKNLIENQLKWFINIASWPGLNGIIYKVAPIVSKPAVYAASYKFDFIVTAGTGLLLSGIITAIILKIKPSTAVKVFGSTCRQLVFSMIVIMSVFGFAYVANYSGMSFSYGLAFAATGVLFAIFSPIIGGIGTFITGSETSSGALFAKLQVISGHSLGLNPMLTVTSSVLGASMCKLISPQSIAIATAATGMVGHESKIFRGTAKYSMILLGFAIIVSVIFIYLLPFLIPST